MKYMLMLFDHGDWNAESDTDVQDELDRHRQFAEWCAGQGIGIVGGEALHSSTSATTLRRSGDDILLTDGPAAELKENLGGFYIIECRDLDQAIEAARHCPLATATEVRPVWDFGNEQVGS